MCSFYPPDGFGIGMFACLVIFLIICCVICFIVKKRRFSFCGSDYAGPWSCCCRDTTDSRIAELKIAEEIDNLKREVQELKNNLK